MEYFSLGDPLVQLTNGFRTATFTPLLLQHRLRLRTRIKVSLHPYPCSCIIDYSLLVSRMRIYQNIVVLPQIILLHQIREKYDH